MAVPKFEVGQKVKVVKKGSDSTFPSRFVGRVGVVEKHDTLNCGASQHDPMNIVRFSKKLHDGFWNEELEEVKP